MMTGDEYRATLGGGRATFFFEGDRIEDIRSHPILGVATNVVADCYDRFYSPESEARSPLMGVPKFAQELKDRIPLLHSADMLAHVTYSSIMTLITAANRMPDMPVYTDRIMAYVEEMQRKDLRITQCITDAKGDRGLPPGKQPDPDSYCRRHGKCGLFCPNFAPRSRSNVQRRRLCASAAHMRPAAPAPMMMTTNFCMHEV